MPSPQNATPLYPFENPVHALVPVGMGLFCWMLGTAFREIGKRPNQTREITRHNPWTVLFKGRSNTPEEERTLLSDGFFRIYSVGGVLTVWFGYGFGALGLTALIVSLSKKLF